MKTIMVATRRNFTPEQKAAYQYRVRRRRVALTASNMSALAARLEPYLTRMGEAFRATAPAMRSAGDVLRDNFKGLRMTPLGQEALAGLAEAADQVERDRGSSTNINRLEMLAEDMNDVPIEQQFPEGWTRR